MSVTKFAVLQGPFQSLLSPLLPKIKEVDLTHNALGSGSEFLEWLEVLGIELSPENRGSSILLANNSLGLEYASFETHIANTTRRLDLSGNLLTGHIDRLGRLTDLVFLDLHNNLLDGTLDSLGQLWMTWHPIHNVSNVRSDSDRLDVYLSSNQFTGTLDFLTRDTHNMHLKRECIETLIVIIRNYKLKRLS
eukprot:SAG31_NODE_9436_length_1277_cov_1.882852_1_plen_192_part_00